MHKLVALVTAYHRTSGGELELCLQSLADQTRPADEIVVVFDGPVSPEVRAVAEHHQVRLVELEMNLGSGLASQAGMDSIDAEYVARLDSDDAAKPDRFAIQLDFLERHPHIGAVGTAVEEFSQNPGDGGKIRCLPGNPEKYARINSPINNPSVMLRTRAVRESGGYRNIHFMEDYDLYARMIAHGWSLQNLPQALTFFRVNPAQFERRTGREMFAAERKMQANLVEYGLIGPWRAKANLALRTAYRLLPPALLTRAYSKLFHRRG
ncbi:glycosyltransferase [Corynebacterium sp. UBA2622]|uniref:glycosyltransferase n=1 Tax=Corynebacterium sp. UBA2622 TaxID=1946393 RepID=UPI0025C3161C|nr:glycosyltransferase [Corynebacterium sp. UBA2622]